MNAQEFYSELSTALVIIGNTSINKRLGVIEVTDELDGNYTEDDRSRNREQYNLSFSDSSGSVIYEVSKDRDEHRKVMIFTSRKDGKVVEGSDVTIFEDIQWYNFEKEDYEQRLELKYATFKNNKLELTKLFEDVSLIDHKNSHDWQPNYESMMNIFGEFGKQALEEHKVFVVETIGESSYDMLFGKLGGYYK